MRIYDPRRPVCHQMAVRFSTPLDPIMGLAFAAGTFWLVVVIWVAS